MIIVFTFLVITLPVYFPFVIFFRKVYIIDTFFVCFILLFSLHNEAQNIISSFVNSFYNGFSNIT